ncbi:MAG: hypothetical protein UGF89_06525 [Acutalibacteraceae bacterium]|nr:hypothetical protein [Acutalibacteraceae bacterium]
MKCNSSKVYNQKYKLAQERAKAEREAKLNAMTDEEREAFLAAEQKEKEENSRKARKALAKMAILRSSVGSPYSKF